jgi:polysaccharide biosynthesis/export protein
MNLHSIQTCHRYLCLVFSFLFILLGSCVTQKELEYLQEENKAKTSFKESEVPEYRLKPDDELYIQVTSQDEAAAGVFASSKDQSYYVGMMGPYGASLLAYSIDKEGNLNLPVIGKIHVSDKTLAEVSGIVKEALGHILNQPVVTVKLVNRYISVLGEVRNPGHYTYSQEKLTIYDAIGLAGDITAYGNRKEVLLIRNENGMNRRININLTVSDILTSNYLNVSPNDIIYVKPLKRRIWGFEQFPFSVILSTLTTALLIYEVTKP